MLSKISNIGARSKLPVREGSIYYFCAWGRFINAKKLMLSRWPNNSPTASLEASGSNKFDHFKAEALKEPHHHNFFS